MAQLAELSLLTPEDSGSNSAISSFYEEHLFPAKCKVNAKATKNKPGLAHV